MTVGEKIKEIRLKLGMSQVDFADKINVSKQTLYKYENNIITNIPSDKIESAAKLGNVSPSYLMGWENVSSDMSIDSNEHMLVETYKELPKDFQRRLLCYASKLFDISNFEEPVLNAAHKRTDINVTDEMVKHDDDIMDDENF